MLGGLRGARRKATVVSATPLECKSAPLNPPRKHSIRFDSARLFDDLVQTKDL
jgi:hypothetical protein